MSRIACLALAALLALSSSPVLADEDLVGPCSLGTCCGCNVNVTLDQSGTHIACVQVTVWVGLVEQIVLSYQAKEGDREVTNSACGGVTVEPSGELDWGDVTDCEEISVTCADPCP